MQDEQIQEHDIKGVAFFAVVCYCQFLLAKLAEPMKREKGHSYSFSFSPEASPSPSPFFFLFFFLSSRNFFDNNETNSSSSSSFSVFTSSGLYQTGGCVTSDGPAGRSAIVKWNAATKVPGDVYLTRKYEATHFCEGKRGTYITS